MKLKALFLIVSTGLIAAVALHSFSPAEAAPVTAAPDTATAQTIRQSTVQIALYEAAGDAGVEAGGRGLGTLVRHNGQTLIITHDHWTHITANLSEAEFRDADGALLLSLSAEAFLSLIRHRDGGTLVLAAPAELATLPAANLAAPTSGMSASQGDTVWVARRARTNGRATVEVIGAAVQAADGLQRLRLRGADGAGVLPGDSGGGVWLGQRFVGNVWSGGLEIRRTLLGRLLGSSQETETNLIFAALLPAGQPAPAGDTPSQQPTAASGMRNLPEG